MLKIEHLTKIYGDKKAVDDLSLHIRPGEIYGFIGHNGAGKTTTIKSCAGILQFEQGEITIDGRSVKTDPLGCKQILAYIPDNPDLYEFLSGIKYLNFVADIFGVSKQDREARIEKYADLFELTGDLAQPISAYSHGMKQKLAIISALIHDPKLIIMDEPFVGLDPTAALSGQRASCGSIVSAAARFSSLRMFWRLRKSFAIRSPLSSRAGSSPPARWTRSRATSRWRMCSWNWRARRMLKTLLRVRMAALLAAFTGQSRKRKNQTKGKAAGYAFLMLYCFCAFVFLFYTSFSQLAAAFFPAGLGWLYFAMFAIMAFALMFIGSVFTAKSQLFEAKDNELLLSMPVPPGMILLSRMAALLAMNFVLELVVALPVFVSWLQYGGASGAGILAFVVIVLALPLFSLAVSCLFAWLVSLITSRMRNTTAVTMVISVVFMLAYFLFCFRMNSYVTQLAANGAAIAGALGSAAPLVWLGRAAADGSLADLGLTLLWTVLPFVLAYVLLNRSFIRIVTTRRGQVKVQYEKKAMRTSSQNAALYRRELARLTSSSGYMLNAGLGLVFELVLAVLAIVKRRELLGALTAIPELYAAAAPPFCCWPV